MGNCVDPPTTRNSQGETGGPKKKSKQKGKGQPSYQSTDPRFTGLDQSHATGDSARNEREERWHAAYALNTGDERARRENEDLKKKNEELKRELQEKTKKIVNGEKELQKLTTELRSERERARREHKDMEKENDELKRELQEKTKKIDKVENKLKTKEEEFHTEKERWWKIESDLKTSVASLREEKQGLLSRLSKAVGDKLTDNNPDIADLSDVNRPTKLAEQFGELYDNQWTEAFEVLIKNKKTTDQMAIKLLLQTLNDIYKKCYTKASDDLEQVKTMLDGFLDETTMMAILKRYKDNRKTRYRQDIKQREKEFRLETAKAFDDSASDKTLVQFVDKCIELCWLMVIQDPPVHIDQNTESKSKQKLDQHVYRVYTESGEYLDYIVWPALQLHENGAILCKGVAQGKMDLSKSLSCPTRKQKTRLHQSTPGLIDGMSSAEGSDTINGSPSEAQKFIYQSGDVVKNPPSSAGPAAGSFRENSVPAESGHESLEMKPGYTQGVASSKSSKRPDVYDADATGQSLSLAGNSGAKTCTPSKTRQAPGKSTGKQEPKPPNITVLRL